MSLIDFAELKVGSQVNVTSDDRGILRGTAVPNAGLPSSGASLGFINVAAGDQSFSAAAGPNQLANITTVKRVAGLGGARTWNFLPTGMATGSLVFFVVVGFNAETLTIQNNGADLVTLSITNPTEPTNPTRIPSPVLVFDGANWNLVWSDFHGT